jgi:protein gp37
MCDLKRVKPSGIFVCDMGELFGDWIPHSWQKEIFDVITLNPWHRFYLLTKQPQNLIKFSPFPPNCYVGVTATNQPMYDNAVCWLNQIQATVKYISIEPLLNHIHLPNYRDVDWLIIGCQTPPSPKTMPKLEWVEEIINAADRVNIPVFIKPPLSDIMNYHREEMPENEKDARTISSR